MLADYLVLAKTRLLVLDLKVYVKELSFLFDLITFTYLLVRGKPKIIPH